ncbi:hypothetical protein ACFUJ0_06220 [Streptomyces sp. NPDC057242]|uniref:hypothetical protein n=1 Tax=unclassified Streptomyces TaxID=2593676 RepID=UPI00362BA100
MEHRTDSQPTPTPDGVLRRAADGSRWRTAGHAKTGEQLYVLDGVDIATCPMWVRMAEAELVKHTDGPLTTLSEGAAA